MQKIRRLAMTFVAFAASDEATVTLPDLAGFDVGTIFVE